tara:strand:- start:1268 stop:2188 length:921 start_codon:yes stop_codon:yes gene_type:complete
MAQPTITTTYAGEFAGQYISAALLSGSTIENGGIEVKPNVKFKEVIKTVSTTGLIVDADCDFVTAGTVDLNERIIEPTEFQVNLELCKKNFRSDWEAVEMGYSAFDNLPPSFSDFLIGHVSGKVAEKTEQNIWSGDSANAGEFDGFTKLILADATSQKIVGVPVNAANVIEKMGDVVDLINPSLYGKEDLYIYVSQNVARAYVRALGGFSLLGGANGSDNKGTQWYGGGELTFDGVKVFVANGLADNTMIAGLKSNLFFGTGLLSDSNEVKVLDMGDLDGSQNVRVIMRFTSGVQYGIGSDLVIYS